MPKYFVSVPTWTNAVATIEADSPEDAIEAFEAPYICAQCAGYGGLEGAASFEVGDDLDWDNATATEVQA